jgi:SAM-dependent methyltransferase
MWRLLQSRYGISRREYLILGCLRLGRTNREMADELLFASQRVQPAALLDAGYSSLAVLDLSGAALGHARTRLGERATAVEWFEADVTSFQPPRRFAVWHDRAVFHFLTNPVERRGYVSTLLRTLQPGGHVVIATFAPDGPPKCSGLEVVRYDEASITTELGPSFALRESRRETHTTPWETEQRFIYFRFQYLPQ